MELRAAGQIDASPEAIFRFLESFDHHLELIGDRVESLRTTAAGSRVRLRGPLGARRTLKTELTYAKAPESIVGRVEAGPRTRGTVRWLIQRSDPGSWVEVVASTTTLGLFDRLLLAAGGRRWLKRSLTLALRELQRRTSHT